MSPAEVLPLNFRCVAVLYVELFYSAFSCMSCTFSNSILQFLLVAGGLAGTHILHRGEW